VVLVFHVPFRGILFFKIADLDLAAIYDSDATTPNVSVFWVF
jgi:hypothetical protein